MEYSIGGLSLAVDHVAFVTADLDRARRAVRHADLAHTPEATATWPDPDGPRRAATIAVIVADGYLDIVEGAATGGPVLSPTGVVLRAESLDQTREALMARGVRCGRPYRIDRRFRGCDSARSALRDLRYRHRLTQSSIAGPARGLSDRRPPRPPQVRDRLPRAPGRQ